MESILLSRVGPSGYGREDPLVRKYASDMERGDKFPPVLLQRRRGAGGLRIMDGHHRVAAARSLGLPHIDARIHASIWEDAPKSRPAPSRVMTYPAAPRAKCQKCGRSAVCRATKNRVTFVVCGVCRRDL
jgi:hypothetical protein